MHRTHRRKLVTIITTLLGLLSTLTPVGMHTVAASTTTPSDGAVIRCGTSPTLYTVTAGTRQAFTDLPTFATWYPNNRSTEMLSTDACSQLPLTGIVTARPGSVLVKMPTRPEVFAIAAPNVLRHVANERVATALYGSSWNRFAPAGPLRVLPESLFTNYAVGAPITDATMYRADAERSRVSTVAALVQMMTASRVARAPTPTAPSPPAETSSAYDPAPVRAPSFTPAVPSGVGITNANQVIPRGTGALPSGYNAPTTVATYGTTVRRITDRATQGGFGTHTYSQLQAFSADNAYVLLNEDGAFIVRRVDTLARASVDLGNTNAPRWQPALPHTIVAYDTNEDATLRVEYFNVDTGTRTTHYTFPASYQRIRGNQSFDELSHDGRWMGGMAATADGDTIFAVDLANKTLGAQLSLRDLYRTTCTPDAQYGAVEPDWVGVSPLGTHLVVQWKRSGDGRCGGLETFDIRTGRFLGRLTEGHQHGDLGVDRDGTEFFMTFGFAHPIDTGRPGQAIHRLPGPATGSATPKYLQLMDWGNQSHISCQGPNGVCLVTSGSEGSWSAFEGEVWLQYTDGRVLRLAQHRSTECGYWVQPRASMSRDGRYVIFASDNGTNRCGSDDDLGSGDAYLIELPANLTAAGITE
ncbi:hypothetical protein HY632_02730 [Candidatus Uhrbacteria bacterium]|nr:hypothetical protein [Candidatus Uhrbacteria bacterium]